MSSGRIRITFIRHGKPVADHRCCSAAGFAQWLTVEGDRGLDEAQLPSLEPLPPECRVYCSDLRRATNSAACLATPAQVCADLLFREAGLGAPYAPGFVRMPLDTWTLLARIAWFLRWVPGPESPREASNRAREAARRLDAAACQYGQVAIVGHGLFNALVARELRLLGWVGPRRPGRQHGARTSYEHDTSLLRF